MGNILNSVNIESNGRTIPKIMEPDIEYNFSCDDIGQELNDLWITFEISLLEKTASDSQEVLHKFCEKFISVYKDWTPCDIVKSDITEISYCTVEENDSNPDTQNNSTVLSYKIKHRVPLTYLDAPGHPLRLFQGLSDWGFEMLGSHTIPMYINEYEQVLEILSRSFHNRVLMNITQFSSILIQWLIFLSDKASNLLTKDILFDDIESYYTSLSQIIVIIYHFTGDNHEYLTLPDPSSTQSFSRYYSDPLPSKQPLYSPMVTPVPLSSPIETDEIQESLTNHPQEQNPLLSLLNTTFPSFDNHIQVGGEFCLFDCTIELLSIAYKICTFLLTTPPLNSDTYFKWLLLCHRYLSITTISFSILRSSSQNRLRKEDKLNLLLELLKNFQEGMNQKRIEGSKSNQICILLDLLFLLREATKCNDDNCSIIEQNQGYVYVKQIWTSILEDIFNSEQPLELVNNNENLSISMDISSTYILHPKGLYNVTPHPDTEQITAVLPENSYGFNYNDQYNYQGLTNSYLDFFSRLLFTLIIERNDSSIYINKHMFSLFISLFDLSLYTNKDDNKQKTSIIACYLLEMLNHCITIAPSLYIQCRQFSLIALLLSDTFLPNFNTDIFKYQYLKDSLYYKVYRLSIEDQENISLWNLYMHERQLIYSFIMNMILYSSNKNNIEDCLMDLNIYISTMTKETHFYNIIQMAILLRDQLLSSTPILNTLRYSQIIPSLCTAINSHNEIIKKSADPLAWSALYCLLSLLDVYFNNEEIILSTCIKPYVPISITLSSAVYSKHNVYTTNQIEALFILLDNPNTTTFSVLLLSHLLRLSTSRNDALTNSNSKDIVQTIYSQFGLSISRIRSSKPFIPSPASTDSTISQESILEQEKNILKSHSEISDSILLKLLDIMIYIISENPNYMAIRQKAFTDANIFIHLLSIFNNNNKSDLYMHLVYKTVYILGFLFKDNKYTKQVFAQLIGFKQLLNVFTSTDFVVSPVLLQYFLYICTDKIGEISIYNIENNDIMSIPDTQENPIEKEMKKDFIPNIQEETNTSEENISDSCFTPVAEMENTVSEYNHMKAVENGDCVPDIEYIKEFQLLHADVVYVYMNLLLQCDKDLQRNALLLMKYILQGNYSTLNLTYVTSHIKPSLVDILLNISFFNSCLLSILYIILYTKSLIYFNNIFIICSVHYITVQQLKRVFSLLHTKSLYRPSYSTHILYMFTQLFTMSNTTGPEHFFLLGGQTAGIRLVSKYIDNKGQDKEISGLPRFPSSGYTFSMWFNLKSFMASWSNGKEGYMPTLLTLLDKTVSGLQLYLNNNNIFLKYKTNGTDVDLSPINFDIKENQWYHLVLTHSSPKLFSSKTNVQIYINGNCIYDTPAPYPSLVNCNYAYIGTMGEQIPLLSTPVAETSFNGFIGTCYFFSKSISNTQARGLFNAGPDYMYNFEPKTIDKRIYNQEEENKVFLESILDGSLYPYLLYNINPSVPNDLNTYICDVTPKIARSSKWGNIPYQFDELLGYIQKDTYICPTKMLHSMLDCIGGISCIFPLVNQFDLMVYPNKTYIPDPLFCEQFFKMISAGLRDNPANQHVIMNNMGISILGHLLLKSSPYNITINMYKEIFSMLEVGVLPHEIQIQIAETFIFNPSLYIYSPFEVQDYIWKNISTYTCVSKHVIKEQVNVDKLVFFSKYYYANVKYNLTEELSEMSDSLGKWLCLSDHTIHPYSGEQIGQKPTPEEATSIRKYLFGIMKQILKDPHNILETTSTSICNALLWSLKNHDYVLLKEYLNILETLFEDLNSCIHFITVLTAFSHVCISIQNTSSTSTLSSRVSSRSSFKASINNKQSIKLGDIANKVDKKEDSLNFEDAKQNILDTAEKVKTKAGQLFNQAEKMATLYGDKMNTLLKSMDKKNTKEQSKEQIMNKPLPEIPTNKDNNSNKDDTKENTNKDIGSTEIIQTDTESSIQSAEINLVDIPQIEPSISSITNSIPDTIPEDSRENIDTKEEPEIVRETVSTLEDMPIAVEEKEEEIMPTEPIEEQEERPSSTSNTIVDTNIKTGVLPLFFTLLTSNDKDIHIQIIKIFSKIISSIYTTNTIISAGILKSLGISSKDIIPICLYIQEYICKIHIDMDICKVIYECMMTGYSKSIISSDYEHKIMIAPYIYIYIRSLYSLPDDQVSTLLNQFINLFTEDKASAYNYSLLLSLPNWLELFVGLLASRKEHQIIDIPEDTTTSNENTINISKDTFVFPSIWNSISSLICSGLDYIAINNLKTSNGGIIIQSYIYNIFVYLNGLDTFAYIYKEDLYLRICNTIEEYLKKPGDWATIIIVLKPTITLLEELLHIYIHKYDQYGIYIYGIILLYYFIPYSINYIELCIDVISMNRLVSAYISVLSNIQTLSVSLMTTMTLDPKNASNPLYTSLKNCHLLFIQIEIRTCIHIIQTCLYYLNPTPIPKIIGQSEILPNFIQKDTTSEEYKQVLLIANTTMTKLVNILERSQFPSEPYLLIQRIMQNMLKMKKICTIEDNSWMDSFNKILSCLYTIHITSLKSLLIVVQNNKPKRKWLLSDKMKQEAQKAEQQETMITTLLGLSLAEWDQRETSYERLIISLGYNGKPLALPVYSEISKHEEDVYNKIETDCNEIDVNLISITSNIEKAMEEVISNENLYETIWLKSCLHQYNRKQHDVVSKWNSIYQNMSNDRGPWSDLNIQKEIVYTLSSHLDHQKQHKYILDDPHGTRHYDAQIWNISTGEDIKEEEPIEDINIFTNKIMKDISESGLEEQASTTSSPSKTTTRKGKGKDVLLFKKDCIMVTPLFNIPGKLELYSSNITFEIDPEFEKKYSSKYSENKNEDNKRKGEEEKDLLKLPEDRYWKLSELREEEYRRYQMRSVAVELFFIRGNSVFFAFDTSIIRDSFHDNLRSLNPLLLKPFSGRTVQERYNKNKDITNQWLRREISTFEYLMDINKIAGRTFNDLSQYYVMPWVLSNYTSETIDLNNRENYRDLSLPIGAQDPKKRERLKDKFDLLQSEYTHNIRDTNDALGILATPPRHYAVHYSNSANVLWYLIRFEPYTSLHIVLQDGKFDRPDRQFYSMEAAYHGVITNDSDVKELIPEFFYLPDFLKNNNKLDLGTKQDSHLKINDVILPPWAKTAEEFIHINREALESDYVSQNINNWIDLVFGIKQTGKLAEESYNVFSHMSYVNSIDLDLLKQKDIDTYNQACSVIDNFGQTPVAVFTLPHKPRRSITIPPSLPLPLFSRYDYYTPSRCIFTGIATGDATVTQKMNETYLTLYNSPTILPNRNFYMNIIKPTGKDIPIELQPDPILKSTKRCNQLGQPFASIYRNMEPMLSKQNLVAHNRGDIQFIWSCGYWDKSFKRISISNGESDLSIAQHQDIDIVSCLCISPDGSILISGSCDSTVKVWIFKKDTKEITLKKAIYGHDDTVTNVSINRELDLIASASLDGTIILSSLVDDLYLRSINVYADLDVSRGERAPIEDEPKVAVDWMRLTNDGNIICYSQEDFVIRLYNSMGQLLNSCEVKCRLFSLCLSNDTEFLLVGGENRTLYVYRVNTLKEVLTEQESYGGRANPFMFAKNPQFPSVIRDITLSFDETLLFVGLENGEVYTIGAK
ncbi:hypothetical protein WA158_003829 [Blastocystis sp. Blastoise]